jgi:HAD superfamily hydrolase (TIGR01549 family)
VKPVKALFLDLDGTLLDGSRNREAILRTCGEVAAAQPGMDERRLFDANAEAWGRYWPEVEHSFELGRLDGVSISLEAWRRALLACGCDDPSVAALARETHWRLTRETLQLFDDVEEMFDLLPPDLPLALITNGASDTQRWSLGAVGIEQRFGAIVISGELGCAKPDSGAFRCALEKLGVDPESVWHVGDNLRTDVGGAKAAGITAVWLNRKGIARTEHDPEPDHEIRSLRELRALLR